MLTIAIPTYNSAQTLGLCLDSVYQQTQPNFEVVLLDGGSVDATVQIAQQFGVDKLIAVSGGLLQARAEGVRQSAGEYILFLDSDQILTRGALRQAVELVQQGCDMLVFGEQSYQTHTLTEKLFSLDRKLLHTVKNFDPAHGALLPRLYRAALLRQAMKQIPVKVREDVGGEDHAIIFWEAWQISQKVAVLPRALQHVEPQSLREVWSKAYRWGQTSRLGHTGKYQRFLAQRPKARLKLTLLSVFSRGMVKEGLASLLLMSIRGLAYYCGLCEAKGLIRGKAKRQSQRIKLPPKNFEL